MLRANDPMGFHYEGGSLYCEGVPVTEAAERFGTPTYVYSQTTIVRNFLRWENAFGGRPHTVCYAAKANSTMAVLELLAGQGAGFDIVSRGELLRVLAAGADPGKVVFSGVGKSRTDIAAAIEAGIRCFNVEGTTELRRIGEVASALKKRARCSVRLNPDIMARTNPKIATGHKDAKFGVSREKALEMFEASKTLPNIEMTGLSCHIGSQIHETEPFEHMAREVIGLARELEGRGFRLDHLDFGGGAAGAYTEEERPLDPALLVEKLIETVEAEAPRPDMEILVEPGRSIVASAGILLTRVEYVKQLAGEHACCIVDASMTELIRPTLYGAWHLIEPVRQSGRVSKTPVNVVGPVCETGDWLGLDRAIAAEPGDLLAVWTAGAYGMSMASNYNSRPLPMEVLVRERKMIPLREKRPDILDVIASERRLGTEASAESREAFERARAVHLGAARSF